MADNSLKRIFEQDAPRFIRTALENLLDYENDRNEPEKIHEAYRAVHSLKSEAYQLEYNDIAQQAHLAESEIDDIRSGKNTGLDTVFAKIHEIEFLFDKRITAGRTKPEDNVETETEIQTAEPAFSRFDLDLLKEARERNEVFFRVVCELDDDAAMKYPKLYLLVNNLELAANVIKVLPPLEELKAGSHERVTVYYTSSRLPAEIRKELQIDQVKRIHFTKLEYGAFINGIPGQQMNDTRVSRPLSIDSEEIDKVLSYTDELKIRLFRLARILAKLKTDKDLAENLEILEKVAAGIEANVKNMRMVSIGDEFLRYHVVVRDLSRRLGKKARLMINGGDLRVDRGLVEVLSEPILHLVRNAVDHGIEKPGDRAHAGKDEVGTITLRAENTGSKIIIEVSDDGKGIDTGTIVAKARSLDIKFDDSADLLSILAEPGFTTKEEISNVSGRGVGLDLVRQKVSGLPNAALRVFNYPGEGCSFIMEVPSGFTLLNTLLVRCSENTIAVPARNIRERIEIDQGRYRKDGDGLLFYDNLPVFTIDGRLFSPDANPEERWGLHLGHMNGEGLLLIDEILFQQQLPEDQLVLLDTGSSNLYNVSIGGRRVDFFFLNPSYIVSS